MKEEPQHEAAHTPLPNGNYKYGDPYPSGVLPVFGAHDQLLWYSVPGLRTRFERLSEAESILLDYKRKDEISQLAADNLALRERIKFLESKLLDHGL